MTCARTWRQKPRPYAGHPFASMSASEKIRQARTALAVSRELGPPGFVDRRAIARWEATLRGLGVEP